MKVKSFLLTALAASMVLASCDKNESDINAPTDKSPKSVTIKLANLQKNVTSRGLNENVTSEAAKLNNFTIFFVDDTGKFYDGYAAGDVAKDTPLKRDYNAGDEIPTFHYLDASVSKVLFSVAWRQCFLPPATRMTPCLLPGREETATASYSTSPPRRCP